MVLYNAVSVMGLFRYVTKKMLRLHFDHLICIQNSIRYEKPDLTLLRLRTEFRLIRIVNKLR